MRHHITTLIPSSSLHKTPDRRVSLQQNGIITSEQNTEHPAEARCFRCNGVMHHIDSVVPSWRQADDPPVTQRHPC